MGFTSYVVLVKVKIEESECPDQLKLKPRLKYVDHSQILLGGALLGGVKADARVSGGPARGGRALSATVPSGSFTRILCLFSPGGIAVCPLFVES
jgi:hypothetical protein